MAVIFIESPGFYTTVQDHGRYGYQRYGMPVSGAMDTYSLILANLLVGNPPGAAVLEATFTGPEIMIISKTAIAITGADMGPLKNGVPVTMNMTIKVKDGDLISFAGLTSGCRTYIAFAGGIDVPQVMGSRSTYLRARLGGYQGRILKTGDQLQLGVPAEKLIIKKVPTELLTKFKTNATLRIIKGPEYNRFTTEGIFNLLSTEYTVTDQSDRMGYRLSGALINHDSSGADILSAGISPGTIQVPGNGQPVILMADRQTTGGYTRIANVISADLSVAAQLIPGNLVRFSEITAGDAHELLLTRQRLLESYFTLPAAG